MIHNLLLFWYEIFYLNKGPFYETSMPVNFLTDEQNQTYARYPEQLTQDQQTSLDPREIMTDTAGASEIIFALFWLLGYQFSPRLADIGKHGFGELIPQLIMASLMIFQNTKLVNLP